MAAIQGKKTKAYLQMSRADGGGFIWLHDDSKNAEDLMRISKHEHSKNIGGPQLIGNWVEERSDVSYLRKIKGLPSQYAHNYKTISGEFNKKEPGVPQSIKYLIDRPPRGYSCHQPELDPQCLRNIYNSWETTYRAAYMLPALPHHLNRTTKCTHHKEKSGKHSNFDRKVADNKTSSNLNGQDQEIDANFESNICETKKIRDEQEDKIVYKNAICENNNNDTTSKNSNEILDREKHDNSSCDKDM